MVSDPVVEERLEADKRQRFMELLQQIDGQVETDGLPAQRPGRREGFRLAYYPPIAIDKQVMEWFARRTGTGMSLTFAVNRVLLDYIDAVEHEQKKAG